MASVVITETLFVTNVAAVLAGPA